VGIATRESPIPSGLQIVAFLSNSPARDAGLQIGDVIISVGGEPALGLRQPWGNPGEVVQIGFQRPGTNAATAPVTIADLLPDP
jgi:S1-C subfamily serine protease